MYKIIALILIVILAMTACSSVKQSQVRTLMEYAYFEGQRDALGGDVRIEMSPIDGRWLWVKSPWDDYPERIISFQPTEFYKFRPISVEEAEKMLMN